MTTVKQNKREYQNSKIRSGTILKMSVFDMSFVEDHQTKEESGKIVEQSLQHQPKN